MTIQALFGIGAGILQLVTCGMYIASILKGETRPDRVTWWVIAFVNGIITAAYFAAGARETIWLPLAYGAGFGLIALLSLKYGEGPFRLSIIDRISLFGTLISGAIWWLVHSPVLVLLMNIVTEFIGLIPTINKSYRRPWTESKSAWVLATIASLLNVCAVTEWSLGIAAYPIYVLVTNILITCSILRKRDV